MIFPSVTLEHGVAARLLPADALNPFEGCRIDIEKRLRLGLEGLAGYAHGPATVVAEGGIVVTEHTESWEWPTGETVTLPFVSVQHVDGDTITLWKDYWDLGTLMGAAPPDWMDQLTGGDMSWITDVTGLI